MDMDRYIGRLLDNRYEILEIIGTGGMAVVYKARCHRLNRLVAIKILKDEFSRDEEFRRRFHAEGEAVAMLSHPNIVQVYDVSSTDNADFIVMELIDGITLKQYMEKKGVLNWKETLHFSMQIAKALEHAHSRNIVHRDIKPHNVMVLKNGSVKVTDFGIARVMSKSNTLTKEALGSVHYISPEQAKGSWVDNRSDLYSLGVVMYEMMAGRPPYDGESPVAVAIQHINGGAAMPSTLNPNIPGGMEQIIMKAMALDPSDRYLSATEMLQDMEEFRKDPSILFEQPRPSTLTDDATRVIQTAVVAEAARQPRNTAERVAGVKPDAQRPRNLGNAQRPRPAEGQRPRNAGNVPRDPNAGRPGEPARRPVNRTPQRTQQEIREEETRNRVATISIIACSLVAIVAIVVFLVSLFNGGILNQNKNMVTVPKLVGEYYEDLEEVVGLEIDLYDRVYDDEYEKGKIIKQEPIDGVSVVQGTAVKVTVSLGPEPAQKVMENLTNQEYETAVRFLDNLKMGLNPLQRQEFNDEIPEGKVIRTDPAVGETLEDGQTVWIYVSSGPVIQTETVDYCIGKKESVAYNALSQKFENIRIEYEYSDEDEGIVIKQSVDAGTKLDVTSEIVLTVSKGTEKIKMISVVGQQFDSAEENLNDLGFSRVSRNDVENDAPAGQVVEQSVSRGSEVSKDQQIILSVSKGPAPTDPPPAVTTPKQVTIQKTFSLPEDRTENYILSLYKDGKQVYEDTQIIAGTTSITVELTGSGTQYYELYINDELYKQETVVFSGNG